MQGKTRTWHVILIESDIDIKLFRAHLADGLVIAEESFSVYVSYPDKGPGLFEWFFHCKLEKLIRLLTTFFVDFYFISGYLK